jgi:hypothetical protein
MEVKQELDNAPSSSSVFKLETVIDTNDVCFKNKILLKYDEELISILPSLEEIDDSSMDGSFFLLGMPTLSQTMNVLNWSLRNPDTIIMGQRLLCPDMNAQLPSALQTQLGQSRADDSCEYCLTQARLYP